MNVLVICTSNINRSHMAEGFIQSWAPGVHVTSAAADIPAEWDGRLITSFSEQGTRAMAELGIDISSATVKRLTPELAHGADIVVSMVPRSELPSYVSDLSELRVWDVEDPGGKSYDAHVQARDAIAEKVGSLLAEFGPATSRLTSAFVIFVYPDNRFLLQHRTEDAPTHPNAWQLWGGAMEPGENPVQTVMREVHEELSLSLSPESLKLFQSQKHEDETCSVIFSMAITTEMSFSPHEGNGYGVFEQEALSQLELEPTTKAALDAWLRAE